MFNIPELANLYTEQVITLRVHIASSYYLKVSNTHSNPHVPDHQGQSGYYVLISLLCTQVLNLYLLTFTQSE